MAKRSYLMLGSITVASVLALAVGCGGDDDDNPSSGGTGADGGSESGGSGTGGGSVTGGAGGENVTGGAGGEEQTGGTQNGGAGGEGGGVVDNCQTVDLGYKVVVRRGDTPGNGAPVGQLVDQDGNVIMQNYTVPSAGGAGGTGSADDVREEFSDGFDFFSILDPNEDGSALYSVLHIESRPGALYLMGLDQDSDTGELTATSSEVIDMSDLGGGWVHCAGSVTPWQTHLASEEYPPDAGIESGADSSTLASIIGGYASPMLRYFGIETAITNPDYGDMAPADPNLTLDSARTAGWNPYNYGFNIEIGVDPATGDPSVAKHYSMGRVAIELAYAMPDEKTVYITDDGQDCGFYMFVASTAGDLSAGDLYAAQVSQTSAEDGGAGTIEWVKLGPTASDAEVKALIDAGTTFDDIFLSEEPDATDGSCPSGYFKVSTNKVTECLQLQTSMELAASRLETRRYAAYRGATVEFNKEEGITFNEAEGKLYLAISDVDKGMREGTIDGIADHLTLPANDCGTVFELNVDDGQQDTANDGIDSDYVAVDLTAIVSGTEIDDDDNNGCAIDGIANPDNLTYIPEFDTLIIGEDTGNHQNDVIWAADVANDFALTRIFSTPYGSETTSPYWYSDIGGFAYLMAVVQHPYGESDQEQLTDANDARAYAGYIGPFPADTLGTITFAEVPFADTDAAKRQAVGSESAEICVEE